MTPTKPKPLVRTAVDEFKALTPYNRLRSMEALKQLQDGRIPRPPLVCGWCQSRSIALVTEKIPVAVDANGEGVSFAKEQLYHCIHCGNYTRPSTAEKIRLQKIRRIILDGVDLPSRVKGARA